VAELKALTRDQDSLIQSQSRLVNQLTACLKASYPVALMLFTKLQQKTTLAFLQTYPNVAPLALSPMLRGLDIEVLLLNLTDHS